MMRKYIIGGIVGLALGLSATAYADDVQSLVGKTIQGQTAVYLDGERLDTAIIVDGKSYTPTRKVAEASGKNVIYNEGGIYLESQETPAPTPNTETTVQPTVAPSPTPQYSMERIDSEIKTLKLRIKGLNGAIQVNQKLDTLSEEKKQAVIEKLQNDLAAVQADLNTWLQRKAALEAQQ